MATEWNADEAGSVLVIDDDADTLELMKRTLESMTQFRVLTAASGDEALSIIDATPVDVVVLDYVMPGMDGAECFKSIKARSKHTPVIFLTGYPEAQREKTQLAFGAFDFMTKPILPRDLVLLVNDAYRTVRLIRSLLQKRA